MCSNGPNTRAAARLLSERRRFVRLIFVVVAVVESVRVLVGSVSGGGGGGGDYGVARVDSLRLCADATGSGVWNAARPSRGRAALSIRCGQVAAVGSAASRLLAPLSVRRRGAGGTVAIAAPAGGETIFARQLARRGRSGRGWRGAGAAALRLNAATTTSAGARYCCAEARVQCWRRRVRFERGAALVAVAQRALRSAPRTCRRAAAHDCRAGGRAADRKAAATAASRRALD